ncbi:MAG TPA: response regulator, partial [Chromatiales bacterium]|nr:response regulator [Chromatiales bacterium]
RDANSLRWYPTVDPPNRPSEKLVKAALHLKQRGVLVSPISVDPKAGRKDRRRFMNLHIISPVIDTTIGRPAPTGAVVINIDVGGIAKAYRRTLWVTNDGRYLDYATFNTETPTAFKDFPGLDQIFAKGKLDLWKGKHGEQIIWVPLFLTEDGEFLWVGRYVDPSPLAAFRNALTARVLGIIFALTIIVWLTARWVAQRISQFSQELTEGISRVLKEDDAVTFSWGGPRELHTLGDNLTELAETHARHNRELVQHAAQLEESNKYKSEFLANVSHELRTPLNSILLLSKLLSDSNSDLNPEQKKQAQVIHEAGTDLKNLIDNILDLSRIEARQATFSLDHVDLEALLQELIELMQPQFTAKGLALKLETEADAPRSVLTDGDKVRQIIKNFLSNAVKFTTDGCVVVALRRSGDPERPVRIEVDDTGIGIPDDKQALIFEAFKQADGSTSRRFGGTGLGLTISRELAELIGGRIELESIPGEGSAFSLLLPLEFDRAEVEPERIDEQEQESPSLAINTPEVLFHGERVLLVDDDVRNLLALTPLLESWGLKVLAAADGAEALETLQEEECALVLMDIMMPEIDGYATIQHIRNIRRLRDLPIIAITAKVGEEERNRAIEAGADGYVSKPIDSEALKALLEHHLRP